jgi:hypothetical protein
MAQADGRALAADREAGREADRESGREALESFGLHSEMASEVDAADRADPSLSPTPSPRGFR